MAAFRLILILLSIMANTCLLQQPVVGDEETIRTLCEWTPEQDSCLSCLMNDRSGSKSKEPTELAAMSINCASALSDAVITDFTGILNGTGGGGLSGRCMKTIEDAKISLVEAMLDWSNYQYGDAGDKVAVNGYSECYALALNIPSPPAEVFNRLSDLEKYYKNAKAILYQL